MNFVQSLLDPAMLGGHHLFRDLSTWRAWVAFYRTRLGLPLDDWERALFQRYTARREPPTSPAPVALLLGPRQIGKSTLAAAEAVHVACTWPDRTGERTAYVALVAQRFESVLTALWGAVKDVIHGVPAYEQMVESEGADEIRLTNNVVLKVFPSKPSALRGLVLVHAVSDEFAHLTETDETSTASELLNGVLVPAMLNTGGLITLISTPLGAEGEAYAIVRSDYGREGADVLVWQVAGEEALLTFNPKADPAVLRLIARDPVRAESELRGFFRKLSSGYIAPEAARALVVRGRTHLPPRPGVVYHWFFDMSSLQSDSCALCVAHVDPASGRVVVDHLDEVRPAPDGSVSYEFIGTRWRPVLESYRCANREGLGDQYALGPFTEVWGLSGLRTRPAHFKPTALDRETSWDLGEDTHKAMTKSIAAMRALPHLLTGNVELLDGPRDSAAERAVEQMAAWRRRARTPWDSVDHPASGHDDVATVVALAVATLGADIAVPAFRPIAGSSLAESLGYARKASPRAASGDGRGGPMRMVGAGSPILGVRPRPRRDPFTHNGRR